MAVLVELQFRPLDAALNTAAMMGSGGCSGRPPGEGQIDAPLVRSTASTGNFGVSPAASALLRKIALHLRPRRVDDVSDAAALPKPVRSYGVLAAEVKRTAVPARESD